MTDKMMKSEQSDWTYPQNHLVQGDRANGWVKDPNQAMGITRLIKSTKIRQEKRLCLQKNMKKHQ